MKIIYTPEGGSKRVWEIDPDVVPWDIRFNTEKATDWPWAVFVEKLTQESAIALQALIWTLRKRDEPRLQRDSVTPAWGVDVDIELDEDEEESLTEDAEADAVEEPGKHAGDQGQESGEA